MKQGLTLTTVGIVVGLAGALALNRLIASLLFGVQPTDPMTIVAVVATITLVAAVACSSRPGARRASIPTSCCAKSRADQIHISLVIPGPIACFLWSNGHLEEDSMGRTLTAACVMFAASVVAFAQQPPAKPMSPEGSAQTQVLGKWSKGERPSFAAGRENYAGGRWIEIVYGRPLQRGRDLFGRAPTTASR